MSILSLVMLVTSILFLYFIFRNINKNNILFDQAFMWIVIAIIMIIISIFDVIPAFLTKMFGFALISNFLLTLAVLFLLVITFLQTVQLSKQREQLTALTQELSLSNRRIAKLESENKRD
ncbi:DUF2304 domain-containing protein [Streptococcus iniae]|uniref:DUF2304 domain-containing protein n=1 Tax=Streptococcus iniae TaxID=1346 RepID=A0A1J0MZD2_STRIN|nr:DUF2304 domain-containing protein [Streptococcus iniae]AGM99001.1 hypothetical protein K710_1233 [Streptococcus iniae SF1]AHY15950.1 membrane protein [Streptococcus iniae]AHY17816.1 membrane protein [Streptococcus iniae]AJG26109.1 membrane protein [Streptococcus iniae]APD31986.1 hypothetical protein BMF34_05745 [Streptococcus iniae]